MPLVITPLAGIPLIIPGDPLPEIINNSINQSNISLDNGDILVIAQKIISKSEGRLVNLSNVNPSERAYEIADLSNKDPRLVELILNESKKILRVRR